MEKLLHLNGAAQPGDRPSAGGHGGWQMRFSAPAPGYQIRIGNDPFVPVSWTPRAVAAQRRNSGKALAPDVRTATTPWCAVDISEYMEKHACERCNRRPSRYVGYEEGCQLTESRAPPAYA